MNFSIRVLGKFAGWLSYNDFFDNVSSALGTFTGRVQSIALAVIIACLVINGVMFMFGEEAARKAKHWIMYVIIGAVVVFGAATIGSTVQSVVGF